MKKIFLTAMILALFIATSVFAQTKGYYWYAIEVVDEFGEVRDDETITFTIDAGGTIYSDRGKTVQSGLTTADGTYTFYYNVATATITVADAANTISKDCTNLTRRILLCDQSLQMTSNLTLTGTLDMSGDLGIESDGWIFDVSDNDFVSKDSYVTEWGTGKDVSITFDGADWLFDAITASEGLKFGDATTGFDTTWYFETAGTINTSYTGDFMEFDDAMILAFGSGGDYTLSTAGSTANLILDSVDDDTFQIGNGTDATDIEIQNTTTAGADISWDDATETFSFGTDGLGVIVILRGDTAGAEITWDEAADDLLVDGCNIVMHDTDKVGFGDASAEGTMYSDGSTVVITGSVVVHDSWIPNGKKTENHQANHTLTTLVDSGTLITVDTTGVVITLPAIAATDIFRIMNIGVDGCEIHVDTNANDLVAGGCGVTAIDDGDKLTNSTATSKNGDMIELRYYDATGWQVTDMIGVWADGGP